MPQVQQSLSCGLWWTGVVVDVVDDDVDVDVDDDDDDDGDDDGSDDDDDGSDDDGGHDDDDGSDGDGGHDDGHGIAGGHGRGDVGRYVRIFMYGLTCLPAFARSPGCTLPADSQTVSSLAEHQACPCLQKCLDVVVEVLRSRSVIER